MEYFIIFGIGAISLFLIIVTIQFFDNQIKRSAEKELSRLNVEHPLIFEGGYTFYTNNHPYVWGEISQDDVAKLIKFSATGAHHTPLDPPIYSIKIEREQKKVYLIPHKRTFDYSKLMHYQEWLDSQKDVAENIAKHKAS